MGLAKSINIEFNSRKRVGLFFVCTLLIFDLYLVLVKLHYGMYWDESFLISQAESFSRDISFFKDSWSAFQFAGVIVAPLSYLYRLFVGSNEGLIFFFRLVWLVVQNILAFATYMIISKAEIPDRDNGGVRVSPKVAACISICLFFYYAYFYSVNYKTLSFWGCLSIVLILVKCYRKASIMDSIGLGVILSLTTLSYESTAIMIVPIIMCLLYISRLQCIRARGYIITVILTCLICAGVFLCFSVSQIGMENLMLYFDKFLGFEGYGQSIILKVGKHAVFYFGAVIVNYGVLVLYEKVFNKRISLSKFVFIYLVIVYIVILFTKPQTITISRVHYIMCVVFTLCIVFVMKYMSIKQKNYYLNLFLVPIGFYVLAIAIATYQEIAVSSMGCVLVIVPLFMICSDKQLRFNGVIGSTTLLMVLVGMIVVPCVYTTNLTVFHEADEITYGPAKGTRPLDTYVNKDVYEWQEMVDKYVKDDDKPLMLGNEYYSVGYLYCNCTKYGTYSPGYVFLNSDRLVKFWNLNTDRQPTVAIIKTCDLPCEFEEFLEAYPIGKYLKDYFKEWNYDNGYAVARKL